MVCNTLPSQDAFTNQIWNSYLKEYRRYAPDSMQFLESRSVVKFKVTVTQLWYATLHHPKRHVHTKFEICTSNNIRDMLRKREGLTDGRTVRLLYASQSSFGGIKTTCDHIGKGQKGNKVRWIVPTIDGQWNKFHQKFFLIMTIPFIRHLGGTSLHLPVLRHTTTEEPDRS